MMQAIVMTGYGDTSVLQYRELPIPEPAAGQVQINVQAMSINPFDYKLRAGYLKMFAPIPESAFPMLLGSDFAGVITKLGEGVTEYALGDEVFAAGVGPGGGVTAQYVVVNTVRVVRKPAPLSLMQTAMLPVGSATALSMIELVNVTAGSTVIIVGASGGVGIFACAIARSIVGDEGKVIGICSGSKRDVVLACGATHVVDYTGDIPAQFATIFADGPKAQFLLDCFGSGSCATYAPYVQTDSADAFFLTLVDFMFKPPEEWNCKFTAFAVPTDDDASKAMLERVKGLVESGTLDGLIPLLAAKVFEWEEYPDAHEAIATGHTVGKIGIKVLAV